MKFIFILLLWVLIGSLVVADGKCIYDRISKNVVEVPIEAPENGPSASNIHKQALKAESTNWNHIRFMISSVDLQNYMMYCTESGQTRPDFEGSTAVCREQDIITAKKKELLLEAIIPEALKLHTERLTVEPSVQGISVPRFNDGLCSMFSIPEEHHTHGVSADMVIYLASGPTSGITSAWAATCSRMINRRPVVGIMNYGPHAIEATVESIRVAAHEIGHAIGFDLDLMTSLGMTQVVDDIRGQKRVVVSSPFTLSAAREHFKCNDISGMELENEGSDGTALSHWERRNVKDELMTGFGGTSAYYTAITMAAFHDMKFYKVIWNKREQMAWGNSTGCDFLQKKCMENAVTRYPTMFCNKVGVPRCTSDLRGLGSCRLMTYDRSLPAEYQYFNSSVLGGDSSTLTDFCPYIFPYSDARCSDGKVTSMPGSLTGPGTMCLKGENLFLSVISQRMVGDVCARVECKNGVVRVQYYGDNTWHDCPEGRKLRVRGRLRKGFIICPRNVDACRIVPLSQKLFGPKFAQAITNIPDIGQGYVFPTLSAVIPFSFVFIILLG